jgi:hypothetical protein
VRRRVRKEGKVEEGGRGKREQRLLARSSSFSPWGGFQSLLQPAGNLQQPELGLARNSPGSHFQVVWT